MADGVGLGLKKEPPIEGALGLSHLASHQATLRFRVPHVTVPLVAALGRFARKSFDEGQYQATIRPFARASFGISGERLVCDEVKVPLNGKLQSPSGSLPHRERTVSQLASCRFRRRVHLQTDKYGRRRR